MSTVHDAATTHDDHVHGDDHGHDDHGHDDHGHADASGWVLIPLVVGAVIGLVLVAVYGIGADALPIV